MQVATAAAHPGAMTAAALVEALGWVLLLPALAVLWNEVRGRGSVLVTIGVWGTVLGVLGFVSSSVLNLVTVALAGTPSGLASLTAMKRERHDRAGRRPADPARTGRAGRPARRPRPRRRGRLVAAGRRALCPWCSTRCTSESGNALVLAAAFLPMAVALGTVGSGSLPRGARRTGLQAAAGDRFPGTPGRLHPASRECRRRTVVVRRSTDDERHDHGDDDGSARRHRRSGRGRPLGPPPGGVHGASRGHRSAARWRSSPSPRPPGWWASLSLVLPAGRALAAARRRSRTAAAGSGAVGIVVSGLGLLAMVLGNGTEVASLTSAAARATSGTRCS